MTTATERRTLEICIFNELKALMSARSVTPALAMCFLFRYNSLSNSVKRQRKLTKCEVR